MKQIVILVALLISSSVFSSEKGKCGKAFTSSVDRTFMRNVLKTKGVKYRNLKFYSNIGKVTYPEFAIYSNRKMIAGMALTPSENIKNDKIVMVDLSVVGPSNVGKGVGLLMYLMTAKLLYEASGQVLYKSFDTTWQAKDLWKNLVNLKVAEKVRIRLRGETFYEFRFREDALQTKGFNELMADVSSQKSKLMPEDGVYELLHDLD